MILAALFIPATTWWASMRYFNTANQTAANEVPQKQLSEIAQKHEAMQQKKELLKGTITGFQQHQAWVRAGMPPDSVEFAPKPMRTTWNGQTDPDRVWHEQRARASELLLQLDASNLDAAGYAPANPSLPRRLPAR